MLLRRIAALLLAGAALASCSGSSGGGGPAFALTNRGLAALSLRGVGELWVLEVSEAQQGDLDRNGDGDALDIVLCAFDLASGTLSNLGLASGPGTPLLLTVGEVLAAFGVSEGAQGNTDLNGDGDADDLVLHVYDANSGVVTNTGLATSLLAPAIGQGAVAFAVSEQAQDGTDLDGDGTSAGNVLHVYDARTQLSTNAQRNVTSALVFHDHAFAFTTDEPSSAADLNGDGDQLDASVFEMYDLLLGGVEQVPLAIRGTPLAVNADDWFLLADEAQSGDLNGDLDADDGVFHEVQPHTALLVPLAFSSLGTFDARTSGTLVALVTQEIDGLDRNGDGDLADSVVVLYAQASALGFTGRAMQPNGDLAFVGTRLGFAASELAEDLDLNGDADLADDVLQILDGATGLLSNTGLDIVGLQAGGGRFLFPRQESALGADQNGDGDQGDLVLSCWDPLTALSTSTAIACSGAAFGASASRVLLVVPEADESRDLNGDGDALDLVPVLHAFADGTNASLGVATLAANVILLPDGRGLLLVSEAAEQEDRNGDGDALDLVLYTFQSP